MNKIYAVLSISVFLGCGAEKVSLQGLNGANGNSCSISGSQLVCTDGTSFNLDNLKGDKGDPGTSGASGVNGSSCTINGSLLTCPDGSSFDFSTLTGAQGPAGQNGLDGSSCSVFEALGGADIICSDGSEVFISDGTSGPPSDAGSKTELCHLPPGNPTNDHTLFVGSQAAVDAHLAHGDTLGACVDGR